MMKNIHSGWGGIAKRENDEIVILVSSLPHLNSQGVPFVFTDSHAYYAWANFYTEMSDLNRIDWELLQTRDFRRDPDDPAKLERYQAEALIHQHCPISGLIGCICYTEETKAMLDSQISKLGLSLDVHVRTGWYFK